MLINLIFPWLPLESLDLSLDLSATYRHETGKHYVHVFVFGEKKDFVIPWPQKVVRLTTLCIEFSIKLPTMWYITTLVPLGVQQVLFLPGSSKVLKPITRCWCFASLFTVSETCFACT